ncbi:MAG TPA: CDP-diacylglycerol--glycerol-3-phosphate 3-phosphatidyltransferase [Elusimicrobiota bacterium]|nr:CDP-diacylglycerol--glycerol-3-phosphate 3-phosphatidyltransferase [Elusimicrobiota bacterium]
MNLPNQLTLARLISLIPFMICAQAENVWAQTTALLIFIGAGVTDLVDGYIARKHNLVTRLGVFMDPLADKLIITAAFITFANIPILHISAWMVILIVSREFVITGLRSLAAAHGQTMAADDGGKFKTTVQTTTVITTLVVLIIRTGLKDFSGIGGLEHPLMSGWRASAMHVVEWIPYWLVFIATLFSLSTGISYLRKNKSLLQESV